MLLKGDYVKVIKNPSGQSSYDWCRETVPIGTICRVGGKYQHVDGSWYYCVTPVNRGSCYFYLKEELEKGHFEWVKD